MFLFWNLELKSQKMIDASLCSLNPGAFEVHTPTRSWETEVNQQTPDKTIRLQNISRCCFQFFVIFTPTWGRFPF